tara:strand:+ start:237 stop:1175 length:939 start_codon:yes stop_codon:yes gene_type:complete
MNDQEFKIAAFYQFTPMINLEELQSSLRKLLESLSVKGTILLATEGINGTIAGSNESMDEFELFLQKKKLFNELNFKISFASIEPFPRLKIKIKDEIVSIGNKKADPLLQVGDYVEPEDWNKLINRKDVLVIDTRNTYENAIGSFENSIQPETTNFREFPDWVNNLDKNIDKNTEIAMFCTGGIRCEKASSLMKQQGFKNVSHLRGGILNYIETVHEQESLWQGECFVFDDRVSVDHKLNVGSYDMCHGCRMPITEDDKQSIKFLRGISCPNCFDNKTADQKKRYAERQKQIDLAKLRNKKHIGSSNHLNKK